jgi:hypothetical protein
VAKAAAKVAEVSRARPLVMELPMRITIHATVENADASSPPQAVRRYKLESIKPSDLEWKLEHLVAFV